MHSLKEMHTPHPYEYALRYRYGFNYKDTLMHHYVSALSHPSSALSAIMRPQRTCIPVECPGFPHPAPARMPAAPRYMGYGAPQSFKV